MFLIIISSIILYIKFLELCLDFLDSFVRFISVLIHSIIILCKTYDTKYLNPNLGGRVGLILPPYCFCSIHQHFIFIKNIRAKFGIPNSPRFLDTEQNSDRGISDFWISDESFIKENCHNSKTIKDIDMKLGPVTKLSKRNTAASKIWTMTSCRQIVTSLFFFCLWLIWSNPEAGFRMHGL